MSWVTDIKDILEKVKFFEIVDEGQIGVHLRKGKALYHEKRYFGKELEQIVDEEKKVVKECGGKYRFLMPFVNRPQLPDGYGVKSNGFPRHPKRYIKDKNLYPGFYWCIPIIDSIYTDHNQERRIVSKSEDMPIVPTTDGHNIALGFVMTQKIVDYYTAYTCGDDYEDLLRGEASSTLAKLASGKSREEWSNPPLYKEIADNALEKLQQYTTNRWGVSVSKLSLTQIIIDPTILVGYGISPSANSYIGGFTNSGQTIPR